MCTGKFIYINLIQYNMVLILHQPMNMSRLVNESALAFLVTTRVMAVVPGFEVY